MIADIFVYPFMQRAIIVGLILGLLLANLGVIATLRKMSFFGEGIAHASLAGIAIAIFANWSPLPVAIIWAIIVAIFIYWLERSTKLHSDTVIGIMFTASMALGVVIMSQTAGYQPELISFLFGSILAIKTNDIYIIGALTTIILLWFIPSIKQLTYLSLSEESATVSGIHTKIQTLIFYIALAIATVLGVKILGIVLVSALLILPAATSRLLSSSFKSYFIIAIIVSEITILLGLVISYIKDLPSGASIVLVGTAIFLLASVLRKIK